MELYFSKLADKRIANLKIAQKKRLSKCIRLFKENPYAEELDNHALRGRWRGYRSISFGGDWRMIYTEGVDGVITFVDIGTHSQLYG